MFIRKRTRYSKQKGYEAESYQVVETYRENGKVKQRVIYNLGPHATPEEVLAEAETKLEVALQNNGIVNNSLLYEPGWRVNKTTNTGNSIEVLRYHIETLENIIRKMRSVKSTL